MSNILSATIKITSPGLKQTTDQAAEGITKVGTAAAGTATQLTKLQSQVTSFGGGVRTFVTQFKSIPQGLSAIQPAAASAKRGLDQFKQASNQSTQSLVNLSRVVQDAPFGFIGIANNLNPLLESFQRLKATTGTTGGALKALGSALTGPAGVGIALSVVSSLLVVFGDSIFKTSKKAEEAASDLTKVRDAINGIFESTAKEVAEVNILSAVLKSETETRERKLLAIKELQKIQPEVFNNLKLEGNAVVGLDAAYKNYLSSLKNVLAVQIKRVQLEGLLEKQLKREGVTLAGLDKGIDEFIKKQQQLVLNQGSKSGPTGDALYQKVLGDKRKFDADAKDLDTQISTILADIQSLSKGVELEVDTKDAKKDYEKYVNDIIAKAKELADFLDKTTIREFSFEVDPRDSLGETFKRAKEFLERVQKDFRSFKVKSQIKVEADIDINKTTEYFSKLAEEGKKVIDDLQKEINRLTSTNPILVQVRTARNEDKDRAAEFFDALGLKIEGINAPESLLTDLQKQIINTANLVKSTLVPAFEGLFQSILSGGNPLKGFFDSLTQAVSQLIQKLLSAAVQALILSAITGGSTSFLTAFKSIAGFRASGGPVESGKSYIVGERGPELFTPNTGGAITSNSALGNFGGINGGMSVNVTGSSIIRGSDLLILLGNAGRTQRALG